MAHRLHILSRWLRANWIEVILGAVLVVAVAWIARTGRALLLGEGPAPAITPAIEQELPPVAPIASTLVAPITSFSGQQALGYLAAQTALGPRPSGSEANTAAAGLIADELNRLGWTVETQTFERDGVPMRNVIARAGAGSEGVLLATHFDTRPVADQDADPSRRGDPVLGANGSASGVSVLLELARVLDRSLLDKQVWLAFLDNGDTQGLAGWPAGAGAAHLAESLTEWPQAMIVINTVGAVDQRFRYDPNSDPRLNATLWQVAAALGSAEWFIPEPGPALEDAHTPFRDAGIPVAAVAGSDYPYRHTSEDTPSQVSAASLERIGALLEAYVEGYTP
jgi:hypothetical protein